jgi:hypothetical protein
LPPDENGKGPAAVWADTVRKMQAAQTYHVAFATQSLSDDVTAFDVRFTRSGEYSGTVTLALVPGTPVSVRRVNGTLYAQGPALTKQPDLFGLTPDQAAQLGSGWLQLTGTTRQDAATLIDRTLSLWTPQQIVTTVLQPDGAVQLAGTETANGEQLILLRDDSGTVAVTRFGAELRRASNAIDSAAFSDLNVPVTVTAPTGALVLP